MQKPEDLFTQVRVAHRLLEAYYQRIFQLVDDVADKLELEFLSWDPTEYVRPCQRRTKVTDRLAWCLLPGVVTQYIYISSSEKNKQQVGDWLMSLKIISDDALIGIDDSQIVSTSPESSKSLLRCDLVMTQKSLKLDWLDEIWEDTEYPELTDEPNKQCMDKKNEIYASAFQIPLEDLTKEGGMTVLIKRISEYREVLLAAKS